jgi:hemerythrin-like domain-containing protein
VDIGFQRILNGEAVSAMTAIQIGGPKPPGFDRPIELLKDCHRRIEYFLGALSGAIARNRRGPLDGQAREFLNRAIEYFRTGLPRHTRDEEDSLFPRLQSAPELAACLAALAADHIEEESAMEALLRRLEPLAQGEALPADTLDELAEAAAALRARYAAHIAREEEELFPAAARLLPETEMSAVGAEMAARRGVRQG